MGFCFETIGETSMMHNYLVIRIRAKAGEGGEPMQWGEVNSQGCLVGKLYEGDWPVLQHWVESLSADKREVFSDRVILLLPGTLVMLYQLSVNKGQKKHMAQVLPFLLEEYLAADVEAFHFSHKIQSGNQINIAVAPKELLQQLIDLMADIKIEPTFIIAENQLFKGAAENTLMLYFEGDYVHIYQPEKSVQTIEVNGFLQILGHIVQPQGSYGDKEDSTSDVREIERVVIYHEPGEQSGKEATESYIRQHCENIALESHVFSTKNGLFDLLINSLVGAKYQRQLVDFRTGPFACYKRLRKQWHAWRWVAAIACLWVVGELLLNLTTGLVYQHKARHFQQEALLAYKKVFPHDRAVVDVRTSLERKLRGARSSASSDVFLKILKQFSGVKPESGKITPKLLDYNDSSRRMSVELKAINYEAVNNYVDLLRKQGLSVNLSGTNREGNQVIAKLVIAQ